MKTPPQWMIDLNFLAGSKNRLMVFVWIVQNPGKFAGDIAIGAGVSRPTASQMIRQLETAGFIIGDLPPHMRRGRAVRYSANRRRLAILRRSVADHLGDPSR